MADRQSARAQQHPQRAPLFGAQLRQAITAPAYRMSACQALPKSPCRLQDYAVPLRTDARSDRPVMVKPYDVNGLFSNLDRILALNVAFLHDLQLAIRANDGSWAQTCRHHVRSSPSSIDPSPNLHSLLASSHMPPTSAAVRTPKPSRSALPPTPSLPSSAGCVSGSASLPASNKRLQNVQYGPTTNVGGAGLRELLAEPFQRIARYPLLLNGALQRTIRSSCI
jgi:hypothetical protein